MTLAPVWRTRFYAAGAALLALWLGNGIAQEELVWSVLCAAAVGGLLLLWWHGLPLGTLLLGGALIGYIAGNRGFAQLYVANSVPLLPAELVLLVGGTILVVQSAFRRELPFYRDALNLLLLAWLTIGTVRVCFDVRTYGFAALRDYAMVYYAGFFFLAQTCARNPGSKRFLQGCVLVGCTLLLPLSLLSEQFPEFFLGILTVRGNPLIFFKGDLIGIFLAVGALIYFMRFEERGRWWDVLLSLGFITATLDTNNRASMLGLTAATLLLAVSGRWRFAATQAIAGMIGAVVILLAAHLTDTPFSRTPLYSVYERVVSLVDPLGERSYSGEETYNKGDNNRFRSVWWQAVFDETIQGNPWFGLGFGHDLAGRFIHEYYPDAGDEFTTRSPHNVVLTIFARMGLAGLLPFLAVIGLMITHGYRAIRAGEKENAVLWCSACIILVGSCLGVVLEGPMGAIVFWTLLGLANANPAPAAEEPGLIAEAAEEMGKLPAAV